MKTRRVCGITTGEEAISDSCTNLPDHVCYDIRLAESCMQHQHHFITIRLAYQMRDESGHARRAVLSMCQQVTKLVGFGGGSTSAPSIPCVVKAHPSTS